MPVGVAAGSTGRCTAGLQRARSDILLAYKAMQQAYRQGNVPEFQKQARLSARNWNHWVTGALSQRADENGAHL